VSIEEMRRQGQKSVAQLLLDHAVSLDVDLMVAGAYGHAKLWERLFGGVAQELLNDVRIPLLMAH